MDHPSQEQALARNRFGLGARPGAPAPDDPRAALLDELARYVPRPPAWAAQPTAAATLQATLESQRAARGMEPAQRAPLLQQHRQAMRTLYADAVASRTQAALTTATPFVERLVHFWANHFALSADNARITGLVGAFEAEAIRPHVLGRFEDLLLAAERHPAMLLYLDQVQSIGPNSRAGQRANATAPDADPAQTPRRRGLNENLAREILELHTLGVQGGYTQDDVTEFARALTGWTHAGLAQRQQGSDTPAPGQFRFQPAQHEPGPRHLLGRHYPPAGESQARAMLRDLAGAPATARHIAAKLARHFAGDQPSQALVARLADAFGRSGGDLPSVYRVLVESPEAWDARTPKFKTPWEWLLSALRALGCEDLTGLKVPALLAELGQPVWRPGSPAGWPDTAADWAAPDALVRRVEMAQRLALRAGATQDARTLAPAVLGGMLSEATRDAIARAESPASALALLLVSPEFLRR